MITWQQLQESTQEHRLFLSDGDCYCPRDEREECGYGVEPERRKNDEEGEGDVE